MDARADTQTIPLCIDLDGTLIAIDTLWEGLVALIVRKPWLVFAAFMWAMAGKVRLKEEVARRLSRDPADWPYRPEVLDLIDEARSTGRPVWLVTGACRQTAESVASHLGVFDRVIHSGEGTNLTGPRKSRWLVGECGDGGFDYAGNSREDIAVFDCARKAIVVAPDRAAARWAMNHGAGHLESAPVSRIAILKAIRVHQWMKNVLIAVPLILNHEFFTLSGVLAVVAAFFSFSFFASAVYVVNDIADLANDRRHPRKKKRPLAAGTVSIPVAGATAGALVLASLSLASLLPPAYWLALSVYALITTAYTFVFKRKLLVDVFTLAALYTLRIIAGAAATMTPLSFWLLAFSIFFFLSLALVKRFVELSEMTSESDGPQFGRSYLSGDKDMVAQAGVASAFSAAMVLALYVNSGEVTGMYAQPWMLWPLCPLILYMLLRIWILASRSQMHEDPVVFILRDWRSQVAASVGAAMVLLASVHLV